MRILPHRGRGKDRYGLGSVLSFAHDQDKVGKSGVPCPHRIPERVAVSTASRKWNLPVVANQRKTGEVETMKAIRFDHHGEPVKVLAIEERPVPEPVDREVRARILASPVNPYDPLYVRDTMRASKRSFRARGT